MLSAAIASPTCAEKPGWVQFIGKTLAHYRVTAAIGAGGMGEVYRATDTKLGREVALKVLPAEMAASPERLDHFSHLHSSTGSVPGSAAGERTLYNGFVQVKLTY